MSFLDVAILVFSFGCFNDFDCYIVFGSSAVCIIQRESIIIWPCFQYINYLLCCHVRCLVVDSWCILHMFALHAYNWIKHFPSRISSSSCPTLKRMIVGLRPSMRDGVTFQLGALLFNNKLFLYLKSESFHRLPISGWKLRDKLWWNTVRRRWKWQLEVTRYDWEQTPTNNI